VIYLYKLHLTTHIKNTPLKPHFCLGDHLPVFLERSLQWHSVQC